VALADPARRGADAADLTWPEVAARVAAGAVLVVPVGSCEQHGPHLPLTADTDVAVGIAAGVRERLPWVVVGPPVTLGSSGEHDGFAGTLSIGQRAVELLLVELGRSADATFERTLLLSAHGGNAEPVARAVATLRSEGRDVRAWSPSFGGDAHAGRTETSLLLHLRPDAVRTELAVAGATTPLAQLLPALRSGGVASVSPTGVLGDPAGATAAEGAALLSAAVDDLAAVLRTWVGDRGGGGP
jgi:mycofactocin system creatininase family protein